MKIVSTVPKVCIIFQNNWSVYTLYLFSEYADN